MWQLWWLVPQVGARILLFGYCIDWGAQLRACFLCLYLFVRIRSSLFNYYSRNYGETGVSAVYPLSFVNSQVVCYLQLSSCLHPFVTLVLFYFSCSTCLGLSTEPEDPHWFCPRCAGQPLSVGSGVAPVAQVPVQLNPLPVSTLSNTNKKRNDSMHRSAPSALSKHAKRGTKRWSFVCLPPFSAEDFPTSEPLYINQPKKLFTALNLTCHSVSSLLKGLCCSFAVLFALRQCADRTCFNCRIVGWYSKKVDFQDSLLSFFRNGCGCKAVMLLTCGLLWRSLFRFSLHLDNDDVPVERKFGSQLCVWLGLLVRAIFWASWWTGMIELEVNKRLPMAFKFLIC